MEFWASRVHSANNNSDDMGDDGTRTWFSCPFCYVDIQASAVSLHLQEQHCFNLKNAVCPICAANLGTDAIEHFTTQHTHVEKQRRRRSQKSSSWNSNSMVPDKDMRELNSYRCLPSTNGRSNVHDNAPDLLLTQFLCSTPLPNPESNIDAHISCNSAPTTSEAKSTKSAMLDAAQEQYYREQKLRAAFVRQLILSTIF